MTHPDPSNPSYYRTAGLPEPIDVLRAQMTPGEFRAHCVASALVYVWRERGKNGDEDLRKAIWYLRMATGDDPRKDREAVDDSGWQEATAETSAHRDSGSRR